MAVTSVRSEPTVADVLGHAADLLVDGNWSRYGGIPSARMIRRRKRRKELCLVGAIIQARSDLGLPYVDTPTEELEAVGFLRTKRGWLQLWRAWRWNDDRSRKGSVVTRLRHGADQPGPKRDESCAPWRPHAA